MDACPSFLVPAIPLEQMIATRFPDLVSSLYISLTKNDFPVPPWPVIKILSLSNYTQRLALVLRKSISHQWGKVIRAKEKTTKEDLILALTAALVQQDQIQREVSRWFTYLTDRTSGCIDKKSACYGRINR